MFFNLWSASIGFRGVAVVALVAGWVALVGWLRRLPRRAPLGGAAVPPASVVTGAGLIAAGLGFVTCGVAVLRDNDSLFIAAATTIGLAFMLGSIEVLRHIVLVGASLILVGFSAIVGALAVHRDVESCTAPRLSSAESASSSAGSTF